MAGKNGIYIASQTPVELIVTNAMTAGFSPNPSGDDTIDKLLEYRQIPKNGIYNLPILQESNHSDEGDYFTINALPFLRKRVITKKIVDFYDNLHAALPQSIILTDDTAVLTFLREKPDENPFEKVIHTLDNPYFFGTQGKPDSIWALFVEKLQKDS